METDEDRIAILRKYAVRFFPDAPPGKVIIRYRPDWPRKEEPLSDEDVESQGMEKAPVPPPQGLGFTDLEECNSKEAEPLGDQVRHSKRPSDSQLTDELPAKKARQKPRKRRRKATVGPRKPKTRTAKQETILNDQSSLDIGNNERNPSGSENADPTSIPTFSIQGVEECQAQPVTARTIPYEYATALPIPASASYFLCSRAYSYYRWLDHRNVPLTVPKQSIFDPGEMNEMILSKSQDMFALDAVHKEQPEEKSQSTTSEGNEAVIIEEIVDPTLTLKNPGTFEAYDAEAVQHTSSEKIKTKPLEYVFFIRDPEIAAIYVSKDLHETEARMPYWATKNKQRKKRVDIEDIQIALESGAISAQSLDTTLRHQDRFHYTTSLLALAAIQETYEELHGATIDPNIIL